MSDFEDSGQHKYRAAALSGIFYPGEEMFVNSILNSFGLTQNPAVITRAILAPHGNWSVMGLSIASAYKSLAGADVFGRMGRRISKVVLLGSIHSTREEGLFVSESDYFETPLGNLAIDRRINDELLSCNTLFELNDIPYLRENTTEIHFPFIKFLFPEASFIPLLVGGSKAKVISSLAGALKIVFEPVINETLFIVSSNTSHNIDPGLARIQSERFISLALENDPAELERDLQDGGISACGASPFCALLGSGLLKNSRIYQVPNSSGSVIDEDKRTIFFSALNFSDA